MLKVASIAIATVIEIMELYRPQQNDKWRKTFLIIVILLLLYQGFNSVIDYKQERNKELSESILQRQHRRQSDSTHAIIQDLRTNAKKDHATIQSMDKKIDMLETVLHIREDSLRHLNYNYQEGCISGNTFNNCSKGIESNVYLGNKSR